ncbi:MAG: hypothetical protein QOC91_42, partial [Solirubrobacteraceae bacterium]|nr:hypothetical protein [Solirubrobacteraceae bacterium]
MSSAAGLAGAGSPGEKGAGVRAQEHSASPPRTPASSIWRWRPSRVAGAAFLLGLAVTAAFALTSLVLYDHNESHLL